VFSFYSFTLLMFRKLNKPQLTKSKQHNFIGIRFSFIFRYYKVFQLSQMFTCGLSDLLLLAVGSLVVFVLREYTLKVHILVSSEHKLCQTWNTCLVSCIYWSIASLRKLLIFFLTTLTIKSYLLIIEYSSVLTVAEWLDGSFESQSRLEKAQQ
jgi:hypothetical protein